MNPDSPSEGPEHRTDTLSPVSPKPLHYPSPSNIPLLESQMDPSFTGNASQNNGIESLAPPKEPHQDNNASIVPTDGGSQEQQGLQNNSINETGLDVGKPITLDAMSNIVPGNSDFNSIAANAGNSHSENNQPFGSLNSAQIQADAPAAPEPTDVAQLELSVDTQSTANDLTKTFGSQDKVEAIPESLSASVGDSIPADVNFQALLDKLSASASTSTSTAPAADALTVATTQSPDISATEDPSKLLTPASSILAKSPASLLPSGVNLPPRPPKQESSDSPSSQQPPNIRPFQTNDQTQTSQRFVAPPGVSSFQIPTQAPPPLLTAGAPGTSLAPINGLPPPPSGTFQHPQLPSTPSGKQETPARPSSADLRNAEDEDVPWPAEVQREYDIFLGEERRYVTEGQWDRFPANSRLFIGNLPTEKVTKRDLFHVFHKYGKLAQVSIKQAYGFIQFLEAEPCQRALRQEQSVAIRGRKVHLEISKPQGRNKTNDSGRNSRNRRSRSPEKGVDRYRSGGQGNRNRGDGWRPGRSPSPRSRGGRKRSPDLYDGRRRSRSPPGRSRYRSPPRDADDDDLPLPRRRPGDVPDVQILAKDEPDRAFLQYVEKSFESRGVRCNVLRLAPRLNEAAVMRRQILEGVIAVMKLNRTNLATQKYQLSLFDRSGGVNNVKFEEYAELDLHICVELVLRARTTHRAPQSDYSTSPYGLPIVTNQQPQNQHHSHMQYQNNQHHQQQQSHHQFSPTSQSFPQPLHHPHLMPGQNQGQGHASSQNQMNLSSAINTLDSSSLQQLLGSLQGGNAGPSGSGQNSQQSPTTPSFNHSRQHSGQQQPPSQGQMNDLARIFGTQAQLPPQQQSQSFQNLAANPAFAGLFNAGAQQQGGGASGNASNNSGGANGNIGAGPGSQQQQAGQNSGQGNQPDMHNIMAQLARYGGR